jgi:hypothetical protein
VHYTQYPIYCTLYTTRSTPYTVHYTLNTVPRILNTIKCTQYRQTLCTVHYAQHPMYCVLYTIYYTLYPHTLYTIHYRQYSTYCPLYKIHRTATHCTLYTIHGTPYTVNYTLHYTQFSCLLSTFCCSAPFTSFSTNIIMVLLLECLFTPSEFWCDYWNSVLFNEKSLVRPTDCIRERLIRNIYSGTVVGSRVLDTGVCVAEIMACSLTHLQYEKHSYLQSCEL